MILRKEVLLAVETFFDASNSGGTLLLSAFKLFIDSCEVNSGVGGSKAKFLGIRDKEFCLRSSREDHVRYHLLELALELFPRENEGLESGN